MSELSPLHVPSRDEEAEATLEALASMPGQPAEEPGWALLEALASFLRRFVVFPSDAALYAVVLWIVHSHAIEAAESTPRLHFHSPEARCGKSRALELMEFLVTDPLWSVNYSVAVLFRSIDEGRRTVLLDEIDTIFGPKAGDNEELRALVNAGHRRGAQVQRMVGQGAKLTATSFDVFAAMVLAGIGDLPRTIADRSITIRMRRRAQIEHVERFRRRDVRPEAERLRDRLAAWADRHRDRLTRARPELPDELDDRAADGWEPLLAIADAAGGDWPQRARAAAKALSSDRPAEDDTIGVRLLSDCRLAFGDHERLPSSVLVDNLKAIEEAPWGRWHERGLTPTDLARLLRHYDLKSTDIRFPEGVRKGYERAWFEDPWHRYLPPQKPSSDSEGQHPQHPWSEPPFEGQQAETPGGGVAPEKHPLTSTVAPVAAQSGNHAPGNGWHDPLPYLPGQAQEEDPVGPCRYCTHRTGLRDDSGRHRCSRCRSKDGATQ